MNGEWNDEIVRLLSNWALWLACDRNPGLSHSSIYADGPDGPRAGNRMPILAGEASDVDAMVCHLLIRYQQPLRFHYCWPGRSDRSKAHACNCSLNTYKTRLHEAHTLFSQGWHSRPRPSRLAA